jgi:CRP/FNR family cyclic AMP-dependent transcriptional regulator
MPARNYFMYLHPLLSKISSEERETLVQHTELRSYRRNEVVKEVNDPASNIYCVANGLLRVAVTGSGGEAEVTTDFLKSNEIYLASAFDQTRNLSGALLIAALPSSVHIVPWRKFQELCSKHPDVLVALLVLGVKRTVMLRQQLRRVSSLAAETLVSRALHELSELAPAGTSRYDKRITQAVIASYTGLSREKVNKVMRDFESRGLVRKDEHSVEIPPQFASSDFGRSNTPPANASKAPEGCLLPDPALFSDLFRSDEMGDAEEEVLLLP